MTTTDTITTPVPDWQSPDGAITLYRGDALAILPHLPTGSVDALICDPPYSSGAWVRSERNQSPNAKYTQQGTQHLHPEFVGDSRSQHGHGFWCALWLSQAHRIVRPGGIGLVFSDWRQLAVAMDAFEAGGWIHRATMTWDKGRGARVPHKAYPRHQGEFILFGSHGPLKPATHAGPFDGVIHCPVKPRRKLHITAKPVELMEQLVRMTPPDAVVLDPFAGSGSTAIACIRTGRRFVGMELDPVYFQVAVDRIREELAERDSTANSVRDIPAQNGDTAGDGYQISATINTGDRPPVFSARPRN